MQSSNLGATYGGKKGQQIGKQRETFILAWLARWRYSTPDVLAIGMSIRRKAAAEKLAALQKRGLVQKMSCLFAPNNQLWVLTTAGVTLFKMMSERRIPERPEAARLASNSSVPHDLAVQLVIALKWSNKEISQFQTTFEMQRFDYPMTPDALVIDSNGKRTAIEFEATQKSAERMLGKFADMRRQDVKAGYLDRHHEAMRAWQKEAGRGWEFIEYIMLSDKVAETYRKHVQVYYTRRLGNQQADDGSLIKDGWIASFDISDQLSPIIKSKIYGFGRDEAKESELLNGLT